MMLARLQKAITISLTATSILWLFGVWRHSPWWAVVGALALTSGYTLILGAEFVLLWFIHQTDPTPRARLGALLRAWFGESLITPPIFCWRQPFFSQQIPDQLERDPAVPAKRGVLFIHGFFCNRGFWTPWLRRLRQNGHPFVAVNLEPIFGPIDEYVGQIDEAVKAVTAATGLTPVLVCHSMGGLAARAWLKDMKAEARVHHVVTIGTPHGGTWLARFGHGANGRQMRLGGEWQAQLDLDMPKGRHTLFTCWYSNCDNIVFPPSMATLPGADNRFVAGAAHVEMAFLPVVMDTTLALLAQPAV